MSLEKEKGYEMFEGLIISSGKVVAPACLYSDDRHSAVEPYTLSSETDIENELLRFQHALQLCTKELEEIAKNVEKKIGKAEAEIFLAQRDILNDSAIVEKIKNDVRQTSQNVEYVVTQVFGSYKEKFASMDNKYLRERATDIGEITKRLLSALGQQQGPRFLCEGQEHCSKGANRIIVATELTADMFANMRFEKVLGFVTEHGGHSSHAAIMARSLGVPAVSGIKGIMKIVRCGSRILIDGDKGLVYVDPPDSLIESIIKTESVDKSVVYSLRSPRGTEVMANASLFEDVKQAQAMNADGIGLFRTEVVFISANRLLSEQEQFDFYSNIMIHMDGKPVIFRLLDVGGDKPLAFLRIQQESNPYLGWRGARFLLGNPDIFSVQLRALLRLSLRWQVNILVPMVVDTAQMDNLMQAITSVIQTVECRPENVKIGAMFEVPSACLEAESIFKQVDFASIGSNDLIQYLFAVDRNNELVSKDYNPEHPLLWQVLKKLSATAKATGKKLSICGEMAGREGIPPKLLQIGISSLSVSPRLVPRVREELSH